MAILPSVQAALSSRFLWNLVVLKGKLRGVVCLNLDILCSGLCGDQRLPLPVPEFGPPARMGIFLSKTNLELAQILSNPKNYRSISRAALIMAAASMRLSEDIRAVVAQDCFRVGIYCAVDPSAIDCDVAVKVSEAGGEFHEKYKKLVPPNLYLRSTVNLAASHLGIIHGIMGPIVTFNHSVFGVRQALEQAVMDINSGQVEHALIGAAFSLEDIFLNYRYASRELEVDLAEGAALIMIDGRNHELVLKLFSEMQLSVSSSFFGIAHPLVEFLRQKNG